MTEMLKVTIKKVWQIVESNRNVTFFHSIETFVHCNRKVFYFVNKIWLNVCLLQWAIADMLSYERWRSGYEDDFEMFLYWWWWRSVPRRRQWFHYLLYSCVRFFHKPFFPRNKRATEKFYKNHFLTD